MPINHTSLPVSSLDDATEYYKTTLAPLGYKVFKTFPGMTVGFVAPRSGPDFWIVAAGYKYGTDLTKKAEKEEVQESKEVAEVQPTHMAFSASSRKVVREWHAASLKAGAKCNGPPGPRPQYHEGYYAAYVIDPDGHNIEVVNFACWWITALQWAPNVLGAVVVAGLGWWVGSKGVHSL